MATVVAHIRADSYRTTITSGRHCLVADEPTNRGGRDAGPAPFDLLLAALGACTAMTLRMYADRKGWPVRSLDIALRVVVGGDGNRIERVLSIAGPGAAEQSRLGEIAERTPVTLTLKNGITIRTSLSPSPPSEAVA